MSDEQLSELPGLCIECGHPCFPELLAKRLVDAEAEVERLREALENKQADCDVFEAERDDLQLLFSTMQRQLREAIGDE